MTRDYHTRSAVTSVVTLNARNRSPRRRRRIPSVSPVPPETYHVARDRSHPVHSLPVTRATLVPLARRAQGLDLPLAPVRAGPESSSHFSQGGLRCSVSRW